MAGTLCLSYLAQLNHCLCSLHVARCKLASREESSTSVGKIYLLRVLEAGGLFGNEFKFKLS